MLASQRLDPRALGLSDYIAYWSAGRLNGRGADPYSPAQLLPIQQAEGWAEDWPNIMYYPPWSLSVVMPFGALPYGISRLLWLVMHLALVLICADRLWRYYGGPAEQRWLAWTVSLAFVPTLIVLRMGQIGPLLLLGVVGFLLAERRGKGWQAGAFLVLAAIKPQLVYLFGLGVLVWAVQGRRWSVLAGGVLAGVLATGLALLWNPEVLGQYRYALANPPSQNITPTLGSLLRLMFGADKTWLQFVPTGVGLLWFPFYWRWHRRDWRWEKQAPVLLLASFLTTSYGAWVFDLVVLLVPVMQAAVWVLASGRRAAVCAAAGFVVLNGVVLALNLGGATYPMFMWVTPALSMSYLTLRRCLNPQPTAAVA